MRDKKINKVFKQTLKSFLKEVMGSCGSLVRGIDECKNYGELRILLENNGEEIADRLDVECDECDYMNDEMRRMSKENTRLEDELFNSFTPSTLFDVEKLKTFEKYKDNYTPEELESLLS